MTARSSADGIDVPSIKSVWDVVKRELRVLATGSVGTVGGVFGAAYNIKTGNPVMAAAFAVAAVVSCSAAVSSVKSMRQILSGFRAPGI